MLHFGPSVHRNSGTEGFGLPTHCLWNRMNCRRPCSRSPSNFVYDPRSKVQGPLESSTAPESENPHALVLPLLHVWRGCTYCYYHGRCRYHHHQCQLCCTFRPSSLSIATADMLEQNIVVVTDCVDIAVLTVHATQDRQETRPNRSFQRKAGPRQRSSTSAFGRWGLEAAFRG